MSALEFFQFLTPGSVWVRPDTKRRVKFLFLTNQKLSTKLQLRNPPQVVYVDENGDVYSRSIEAFAGQYEFNHVDGELEKRLEGIFTFDTSDVLSVDDEDDEEIDLDSVPDVIEASTEADDLRHPIEIAASQVDDLPESDHLTALEEIALEPAPERSVPKTLAEEMAHDLLTETRAHVDENEPHLDVGFLISQNSNSPKLSAADLSDAITRYTREPSMIDGNETLHKLTFKLGGAVTIPALEEVFHPESTTDTVDAFNVVTEFGSELFVYEGYLGVFPEFSRDGLSATVVVATPAEPAPQAAQYEPETVFQDGPPLTAPELPAEHEVAAALPDVSALAELIQTVAAVDPVAYVPDAAVQDIPQVVPVVTPAPVIESEPVVVVESVPAPEVVAAAPAVVETAPAAPAPIAVPVAPIQLQITPIVLPVR